MKLPAGYRYAATYAGIRKQPKEDLGLIVSDVRAEAAAVFTQNVVQAAPVKLSKKHLKSSKGRATAILVNAGNANCATHTGEKVALASCKAAAKALKTRTDYVLPSSTGVIGVELNPKLITDALPKLASSLRVDGFEAVANAILTTDLRMKTAAEELPFKNDVVRVAGMTKGSGMIHPNMATTLGFVMTDAAISADDLRRMLVYATERSFNSLTVDGDMSTNDTLVVLANGASKVKLRGGELSTFAEALTRVMESLARQIAADGEGARKLITINTAGFKDSAEARRVARSIANSPLVKTAIAGQDPNWGRILAAAGYSGVMFDPVDIDVYLQGVRVCRDGLAAEYDEAALKNALARPEVDIQLVRKGRGKGEARFYTCDLTEGYIQINGSYRT